MAPARLLLALTLVVALAGVVPASAGIVAPGSASPGAGAGDLPDPGSAQADDPDSRAAQNGTENTTETVTRHSNPDEVNSRGNIGQVRQWLVGQLAERLGDSTLQLSQGEYDLARQVVGDRYGKRLDQLVDVAGETNATRTFERTRENQRELTNRTQEYEETREEYERARENGNTSRARRLARELERLADGVDESARRTVDGYRDLGEATDRNFTEPIDRVNETAATIAQRQAQIRASLFVETRLTVSAPRETVSFARPLEIDGRLVAANGSVLADRTVTIRVGDRRYRVRTDGDGRFVLTYRPIELPVDATTLGVAYLPAEEAPYLNATAELPVAVEPVTPTVAVDAEPTAVAFADRLTVSGQVRAADVAVPGVPLAVTVGGVRIGTARTDAEGRFAAGIDLPAGVTAGARAVRVTVAQEDRAVTAATGETTVTVRETATNLTLAAEGDNTAEDARAVRLTGRLMTADGTALSGQRVAVSVNGSAVGTIRTSDDGRFATTVDVAPSVGSVVLVTARFDGAETNLRAVTASTRVSVSESDGTGDSDSTDGDPGDGTGEADGIADGLAGTVGAAVDSVRNALGLGPLGAVAVAVVGGLIVLGAGALLASRIGDDEDEAAPAAVDGPDAGDGGDGVDGAAGAGSATSGPESDDGGEPSLLAQARAALEGGDHEDTVTTAYTAGRDALADRVPDSDVLTHWEFYAAVRDAGGGEDETATLRELTEAYEQAAYAVETATEDVASAALAAAETLTGDQQPQGQGQHEQRHSDGDD